MRRLRTLWWLKGTATPLGISVFFVAYFWVMQHPLSTVTVMPLTALDHAIAFRPETLPLYLSLWVYVSLAPALFADARELATYAAGCFALSAVGLLLFLLWPTAVPVFDIDWTRHASMAFMKSMDVAGNACPSMHVAFALFAALWLQRMMCQMRVPRGLRLLSALWCAGIIYSTIATRQHVALDVLAGIALALLVAALQWRRLPALPR
jgi:membrane-associated phospholipid phosphatase